MKKFVCLQAGHQNTQNNCVPALRRNTGAPGEAAMNIRIRDRLGEVLIAKGFMVQLVDATFNCSSERKKDFDLFLAIHGDADYAGDNGGGFVDYPDPSVDDSNAESKRIKEAIESEYFIHSGIANRPRSNANTKLYYMWAELSSKTPCVLIECGQVQDPHDKVILADTDRVANAIARGICKAFGMPFDAPAPVPPTPTPPAPPAVITDPQARISIGGSFGEMTLAATRETMELLKKEKEQAVVAQIQAESQRDAANGKLAQVRAIVA